MRQGHEPQRSIGGAIEASPSASSDTSICIKDKEEEEECIADAGRDGRSDLAGVGSSGRQHGNGRSAGQPQRLQGRAYDHHKVDASDGNDAYATDAARVSYRRARRQQAAALGSWASVSRDKGSRKGMFARFRSALTTNKTKYKMDSSGLLLGGAGNDAAGQAAAAAYYYAQVSLNKSWILWCDAVQRARDASVLMQRAVRHFRHGALARAFYTWLYCFEWAQKSHRKLLQAVAIGNRGRVSRAWRCWRVKASDMAKARRHLLAKSRELEITHEHHLRAIHEQRVAMQRAAATSGIVFGGEGSASSSGLPAAQAVERVCSDERRPAGVPDERSPRTASSSSHSSGTLQDSLDKSILSNSFADRETYLLQHQIASVRQALPATGVLSPAEGPRGVHTDQTWCQMGMGGTSVSSSMKEYSELTPGGLLVGAETVVAYCRARITCHECHHMMQTGELFVCLRHGMPTHLQCFQHVMKTST